MANFQFPASPLVPAPSRVLLIFYPPLVNPPASQLLCQLPSSNDPYSLGPTLRYDTMSAPVDTSCLCNFDSSSVSEPAGNRSSQFFDAGAWEGVNDPASLGGSHLATANFENVTYHFWP